MSAASAHAPADVVAVPTPRHGGGPLVAVCGLAGGAGTTLLAWLIACDALADGGPVLLTELPSTSGGLADLVGVQGGRSLARLAAGPIAARDWPAAPNGPAGLRLATSAAVAEPAAVPGGQLARALTGARDEHTLVVVDCGRLQAADARAVLPIASHVVWTVPAGARAGETARTLLLESELAPPPGGAAELLAVVATRPEPVAPRGHRALRQVVAERGERLVLVPHDRRLAGSRGLQAAPRRLSGAIAAIAGVLQREPPR